MKLKQIAGTMSKKQILRSVEDNLKVRARINSVVKAHTRDTDKVIQYLLSEIKKLNPEFSLPIEMQQFIDNLRQSAVSKEDVV